ncbi:hypothetical protein SAMD00019534_011630 [Acytostelium subglobosum LB1]|uniref:hypothetical protein n=1 Tax=Acytostelium subglobosum LB1 TaxID=1410327 RepID=UPI000644DB64|nr:hypothetical protein SAMD00019534_011630 [Acytostelium subglobosum LB1]GAM17988.1 hypothetical protein SAMD00019534_011630 [Acytostelium subglobosum LB1]|eukprot:XP_012758584.1 hypothetical protein SAMD00019534_011630 [Acytostelium subglobosum LB1]
MIERLPQGNQLKTLDLRVMNPTHCCHRDYLKFEDGDWMETMSRELFGRSTNITSLAIYDECGGGDSAYAMYVIGKAHKFFGHLDQLNSLESLSFDLSPTCDHDYVDQLHEDKGQVFLESLTKFMQQHPTLHTFNFARCLPKPRGHRIYRSRGGNHREPTPEYLPILEYLFTDATCPVRNMSLEISSEYTVLPMLSRTIDSIILNRSDSYYSMGMSWEDDISMVINLKTMVTNTLDLSHFDMFQMSNNDSKSPKIIRKTINNEFRFGLFIGEVYKPPNICSAYVNNPDGGIIWIDKQ